MLQSLQRLLETINDAACGHDVRDFLITERAQLPQERQGLAADEELVLVERSSENYLALYIDEAVLARLREHDPVRRLDSSNIADFWTVLEGISHFSYLMWSARHDRPVSQLDLEMQAEVDKYVASYWLLRAQHPRHHPRELHPALFLHTRVDDRLPTARQHLYADASRYAARFCQRLQSLLLSSQPATRRRAISMWRRFYRLGSAGKVRHIDAFA